MQFSLVSDIHLEFKYTDFNNAEGSDALILAGDVCLVEDLHRFADKLTAAREDAVTLSPRAARAWDYKKFFSTVSKAYPRVLYVKGNHESYDGKFDLTTPRLLETLKEFPNVQLLDNQALDLGELTVFGGTMWTNMGHSDAKAYECQTRMNDYRCIRVAEKGYRKLRTIDTVRDHKLFLQLLDEHLAMSNKPVLVISHHAPSNKSLSEHEKHYGIGAAYASDLEDWIAARPAIKTWVHGHLHNESNYYVGSTNIVCNPLGYPDQFNNTYSPFVLHF